MQNAARPRRPSLFSIKNQGAAASAPGADMSTMPVLYSYLPSKEPWSKSTMQPSAILSFCAAPIALATEKWVSGGGRAVGAVIVRDGRIVGEGREHCDGRVRPYGAWRGERHRAAAKALGAFRWPAANSTPVWRALPCASQRLIGRGLTPSTTAASAADAARAGFDDAFLYGSFVRQSRTQLPPCSCWAMKPGRALPPGSYRRNKIAY